MNYDEMIAILVAAKEGKEIESKPIICKECDWMLRPSEIPFNFVEFIYRVKREPRVWWGVTWVKGEPFVMHTTKESAIARLNKAKLSSPDLEWILVKITEEL